MNLNELLKEMKKKQAERIFEFRCQKYARSKGFAALKIENNGNSGIFDSLFIGNGRIFFVEFKTPKGRTSKEQIYWASVYDKNGIENYVCNDFNFFKQICENKL